MKTPHARSKEARDAVAAAYSRGALVQQFDLNNPDLLNEWQDTASPAWQWDAYNYRVDPDYEVKPKSLLIRLWWAVSGKSSISCPQCRRVIDLEGSWVKVRWFGIIPSWWHLDCYIELLRDPWFQAGDRIRRWFRIAR